MTDERFEYASAQSRTSWDKLLASRPNLAKLLIASALLARYDTERDQSSIALSENRSWLKGRVGQLVAECTDKRVLMDHTVRCLVLRFYGDAGLARLEKRAA